MHHLHRRQVNAFDQPQNRPDVRHRLLHHHRIRGWNGHILRPLVRRRRLRNHLRRVVDRQILQNDDIIHRNVVLRKVLLPRVDRRPAERPFQQRRLVQLDDLVDVPLVRLNHKPLDHQRRLDEISRLLRRHRHRRILRDRYRPLQSSIPDDVPPRDLLVLENHIVDRRIHKRNVRQRIVVIRRHRIRIP